MQGLRLPNEAAASGAASNVAAVALYAAGLVTMLGCSAAYHLRHASPRREWLRRFDHAAIFAMIAGTYTPFTLRLARGWAEGLTAGKARGNTSSRYRKIRRPPGSMSPQ